MEEYISYITLILGWPMLIIGSYWIWKHSRHLKGSAKTFLNIALISFYLLAYSCTMYLTNQPWLLGVIPVFIIFSALITMLVLTLLRTEEISNHQ
jgi:CHASE2 domain-containing sensor protein